MRVVTFVETKSTVVTAMKFNFLLVEPKSGNPGVGEYFEIPQDHLGICKPGNRLMFSLQIFWFITLVHYRYSFLYQKVLHLLKEIQETEQDSCAKSVD